MSKEYTLDYNLFSGFFDKNFLNEHGFDPSFPLSIDISDDGNHIIASCAHIVWIGHYSQACDEWIFSKHECQFDGANKHLASVAFSKKNLPNCSDFLDKYIFGAGRTVSISNDGLRAIVGSGSLNPQSSFLVKDCSWSKNNFDSFFLAWSSCGLPYWFFRFVNFEEDKPLQFLKSLGDFFLYELSCPPAKGTNDLCTYNTYTASKKIPYLLTLYIDGDNPPSFYLDDPNNREHYPGLYKDYIINDGVSTRIISFPGNIHIKSLSASNLNTLIIHSAYGNVTIETITDTSFLSLRVFSGKNIDILSQIFCRKAIISSNCSSINGTIAVYAYGLYNNGKGIEIGNRSEFQYKTDDQTTYEHFINTVHNFSTDNVIFHYPGENIIWERKELPNILADSSKDMYIDLKLTPIDPSGKTAIDPLKPNLDYREKSGPLFILSEGNLTISNGDIINDGDIFIHAHGSITIKGNITLKPRDRYEGEGDDDYDSYLRSILGYGENKYRTERYFATITRRIGKIIILASDDINIDGDINLWGYGDLYISTPGKVSVKNIYARNPGMIADNAPTAKSGECNRGGEGTKNSPYFEECQNFYFDQPASYKGSFCIQALSPAPPITIQPVLYQRNEDIWPYDPPGLYLTPKKVSLYWDPSFEKYENCQNKVPRATFLKNKDQFGYRPTGYDNKFETLAVFENTQSSQPKLTSFSPSYLESIPKAEPCYKHFFPDVLNESFKDVDLTQINFMDPLITRDPIFYEFLFVTIPLPQAQLSIFRLYEDPNILKDNTNRSTTNTQTINSYITSHVFAERDINGQNVQIHSNVDMFANNNVAITKIIIKPADLHCLGGKVFDDSNNSYIFKLEKNIVINIEAKNNINLTNLEVWNDCIINLTAPTVTLGSITIADRQDVVDLKKTPNITININATQSNDPVIKSRKVRYTDGASKKIQVLYYNYGFSILSRYSYYDFYIFYALELDSLEYAGSATINKHGYSTNYQQENRLFMKVDDGAILPFVNNLFRKDSYTFFQKPALSFSGDQAYIKDTLEKLNGKIYPIIDLKRQSRLELVDKTNKEGNLSAYTSYNTGLSALSTDGRVMCRLGLTETKIYLHSFLKNTNAIEKNETFLGLGNLLDDQSTLKMHTCQMKMAKNSRSLFIVATTTNDDCDNDSISNKNTQMFYVKDILTNGKLISINPAGVRKGSQNLDSSFAFIGRKRGNKISDGNPTGFCGSFSSFDISKDGLTLAVCVDNGVAYIYELPKIVEGTKISHGDFNAPEIIKYIPNKGIGDWEHSTQNNVDFLITKKVILSGVLQEDSIRKVLVVSVENNLYLYEHSPGIANYNLADFPRIQDVKDACISDDAKTIVVWNNTDTMSVYRYIDQKPLKESGEIFVLADTTTYKKVHEFTIPGVTKITLSGDGQTLLYCDGTGVNVTQTFLDFDLKFDPLIPDEVNFLARKVKSAVWFHLTTNTKDVNLTGNFLVDDHPQEYPIGAPYPGDDDYLKAFSFVRDGNPNLSDASRMTFTVTAAEIGGFGRFVTKRFVVVILKPETINFKMSQLDCKFGGSMNLTLTPYVDYVKEDYIKKYVEFVFEDVVTKATKPGNTDYWRFTGDPYLSLVSSDAKVAKNTKEVSLRWECQARIKNLQEGSPIRDTLDANAWAKKGYTIQPLATVLGADKTGSVTQYLVENSTLQYEPIICGLTDQPFQCDWKGPNNFTSANTKLEVPYFTGIDGAHYTCKISSPDTPDQTLFTLTVLVKVEPNIDNLPLVLKQNPNYTSATSINGAPPWIVTVFNIDTKNGQTTVDPYVETPTFENFSKIIWEYPSGKTITININTATGQRTVHQNYNGISNTIDDVEFNEPGAYKLTCFSSGLQSPQPLNFQIEPAAFLVESAITNFKEFIADSFSLFIFNKPAGTPGVYPFKTYIHNSQDKELLGDKENTREIIASDDYGPDIHHYLRELIAKDGIYDITFTFKDAFTPAIPSRKFEFKFTDIFYDYFFIPVRIGLVDKIPRITPNIVYTQNSVVNVAISSSQEVIDNSNILDSIPNPEKDDDYQKYNVWGNGTKHGYCYLIKLDTLGIKTYDFSAQNKYPYLTDQGSIVTKSDSLEQTFTTTDGPSWIKGGLTHITMVDIEKITSEYPQNPVTRTYKNRISNGQEKDFEKKFYLFKYDPSYDGLIPKHPGLYYQILGDIYFYENEKVVQEETYHAISQHSDAFAGNENFQQSEIFVAIDANIQSPSTTFNSVLSYDEDLNPYYEKQYAKNEASSELDYLIYGTRFFILSFGQTTVCENWTRLTIYNPVKEVLKEINAPYGDQELYDQIKGLYYLIVLGNEGTFNNILDIFKSTSLENGNTPTPLSVINDAHKALFGLDFTKISPQQARAVIPIIQAGVAQNKGPDDIKQAILVALGGQAPYTPKGITLDELKSTIKRIASDSTKNYTFTNTSCLSNRSYRVPYIVKGEDAASQAIESAQYIAQILHVGVIAALAEAAGQALLLIPGAGPALRIAAMVGIYTFDAVAIGSLDISAYAYKVSAVLKNQGYPLSGSLVLTKGTFFKDAQPHMFDRLDCLKNGGSYQIDFDGFPLGQSPAPIIFGFGGYQMMGDVYHISNPNPLPIASWITDIMEGVTQFSQVVCNDLLDPPLPNGLSDEEVAFSTIEDTISKAIKTGVMKIVIDTVKSTIVKKLTNATLIASAASKIVALPATSILGGAAKSIAYSQLTGVQKAFVKKLSLPSVGIAKAVINTLGDRLMHKVFDNQAYFKGLGQALKNAIQSTAQESAEAVAKTIASSAKDKVKYIAQNAATSAVISATLEVVMTLARFTLFETGDLVESPTGFPSDLFTPVVKNKRRSGEKMMYYAVYYRKMYVFTQIIENSQFNSRESKYGSELTSIVDKPVLFSGCATNVFTQHDVNTCSIYRHTDKDPYEYTQITVPGLIKKLEHTDWLRVKLTCLPCPTEQGCGTACVPVCGTDECLSSQCVEVFLDTYGNTLIDDAGFGLAENLIGAVESGVTNVRIICDIPSKFHTQPGVDAALGKLKKLFIGIFDSGVASSPSNLAPMHIGSFSFGGLSTQNISFNGTVFENLDELYIEGNVIFEEDASFNNVSCAFGAYSNYGKTQGSQFEKLKSLSICPHVDQDALFGAICEVASSEILAAACTFDQLEVLFLANTISGNYTFGSKGVSSKGIIASKLSMLTFDEATNISGQYTFNSEGTQEPIQLFSYSATGLEDQTFIQDLCKKISPQKEIDDLTIQLMGENIALIKTMIHIPQGARWSATTFSNQYHGNCSDSLKNLAGSVSSGYVITFQDSLSEETLKDITNTCVMRLTSKPYLNVDLDEIQKNKKKVHIFGLHGSYGECTLKSNQLAYQGFANINNDGTKAVDVYMSGIAVYAPVDTDGTNGTSSDLTRSAFAPFKIPKILEMCCANISGNKIYTAQSDSITIYNIQLKSKTTVNAQVPNTNTSYKLPEDLTAEEFYQLTGINGTDNIPNDFDPTKYTDATGQYINMNSGAADVNYKVNVPKYSIEVEGTVDNLPFSHPVYVGGDDTGKIVCVAPNPDGSGRVRLYTQEGTAFKYIDLIRTDKTPYITTDFEGKKVSLEYDGTNGLHILGTSSVNTLSFFNRKGFAVASFNMKVISMVLDRCGHLFINDGQYVRQYEILLKDDTVNLSPLNYPVVVQTGDGLYKDCDQNAVLLHGHIKKTMLSKKPERPTSKKRKATTSKKQARVENI